MIKCGSVVLEDENSWSSFVLVPVPLSFMVLSPEYTFQMALALADTHCTANVDLTLKDTLLNIVVDGAIWLLCLVSVISNL